MKKIAFFILFTAAGSFGELYAQQPKTSLSDTNSWRKIGETSVNFELEHEEMMIDTNYKYTALKFRVLETAIDLQSMEIYYVNGDKQAVVLIETIQSPIESRVIELNGGERKIKKVVFEYKSYPNPKNQFAKVELYGLKAGQK